MSYGDHNENYYKSLNFYPLSSSISAGCTSIGLVILGILQSQLYSYESYIQFHKNQLRNVNKHFYFIFDMPRSRNCGPL
jgi:hypothetical protein